MTILIGTDEAGYGPNLGPLLISATVWEVRDGIRSEELYELLGDVVGRVPTRGSATALPHVPIADSKALYSSRGGVGDLERGLLAALAVLGRQPACWRDAWESLAPESYSARRAIPWYADFNVPLPLDAKRAEIETLGHLLGAGLAAAGVRLVEVRSRAVFEQEFNQRVEHDGSKGSMLSHATLDLIAGLAATLPPGPIAIVCDKHGGRNRYARLIEAHFPDGLVEIHGESRARSVYRVGPADRRVEIRFQAKAESCLPVALASMASKYLRELAMRALNAYWRRRVDGLLPTAGYPRDAQRFKASIAATQAALGIEDHTLWRRK